MRGSETMDTVSRDVGVILVEQIRCADAMRAALTREHAALVGGSPEELEAASAAKAQLVEALETLETRRRELTSSADSQGDPKWQQLRDVIAECKEQNLRNGALLKARATNVRVALNALRGSGPDLYSPRGQAPARSDARPLGTA
jgi:flagellar biosynthesis/type III secretory pathway chaperone